MTLTLDAVNARRPRCKQCGCLSDFAVVHLDEHKADLASFLPRDDLIGFVKRCRELIGCEIGPAKATYQHFSKDGFRCHYCRQELADGEVVECSTCGAVNISWVV